MKATPGQVLVDELKQFGESEQDLLEVEHVP